MESKDCDAPSRDGAGDIAMPICSVSLKPYIQTVQKNDKGVVTGYLWKEREKGDKVNIKQLVKVVATTTCPAKIAIRAEGKHTAELSHTPPTPDVDKCTTYKEVIYWATSVGEADIDLGAEPVVTFTATAKCDPCGDCTGTSHDNGKVSFNPD